MTHKHLCISFYIAIQIALNGIKLKLNSCGIIDCYKACLIVQDFNQVLKLDYYEMFSLIVKI